MKAYLKKIKLHTWREKDNSLMPRKCNNIGYLRQVNGTDGNKEIISAKNTIIATGS